jgi:D-alanyl-D-alanine carboxypeptidase
MKKNVTNLLRLLAGIVTLSSIYYFAPWEAGLYYLRPLSHTLQQEVDLFVEQGVDGVIVYVDKKGEEPAYYSSGLDNRINQTPIRPDALFKIASIAKLYDAAAITKLVGEGKVALDGYLSDYLPLISARIEHADAITIRMLIQHRSGIPNYTDHARYHWGELDVDIMDLVLDQPADFKPNTDYAYSNSNYLLIQKIITEVTGAPHGEYIQQTLLAPLGLSHTFFSINDVSKDRVISGYHVGYEDDLRHLDHGYLSTAKDVSIFLRALNEGTFFSEQEKQIYTSLYEYDHTGWVLGYQSIARYHEQEDMVVIQFVSTTGNDSVMLTNILYDRVMHILRAK